MITFNHNVSYGPQLIIHLMRLGMLCVLFSFSGFEGYAIEPEPDWAKRFEEVKKEELAAFKPAAVGDQITVIRRVGGELSGRVTGLTTNSISINGVMYRPAQLVPESCDMFYPGRVVEKRATKRILTEQQNYQIRKEEEVEQLKEESRKLEQERRVAAEQAHLQQEAQTRLEAVQRKELAEKQRLEQRTRNLELALEIAIVLLVIMGGLLCLLVIMKKLGNKVSP